MIVAAALTLRPVGGRLRAELPPQERSGFEIGGGPSGIRTQDRRIKSQWLKLQNSTKNARNCTKLQENAGNCKDLLRRFESEGDIGDT